MILAALALSAGLAPIPVRTANTTDAPKTAGPPTVEDTVKVDKKTEAIINGALKYLADQQLPDGSWTGEKSKPPKYAVAMTSYVMMAFLANGNLPDAGPYAKQVRNGVQFLLDAVQSDGTFNLPGTDRGSYMYSHGLGTMVLAEVYGETKNAVIRAKLDHAVLLIIHAQNPEGGWRYQPGSKDADLSVTVPQTVALCAAKRAGIAVPQITIDKAVAYIKNCAVGKTGGFSYQAGKPSPGPARTGGAIYALQICGLYDDPLIAEGSHYLMAGIEKGAKGAQADPYGNYYAGVAHYLIGGEVWKTYYQNFGQDFLLSQVTTKGDMSYWIETPSSRTIGSNWGTAVFTTILSLPYGYVPLYQR